MWNGIKLRKWRDGIFKLIRDSNVSESILLFSVFLIKVKYQFFFYLRLDRESKRNRADIILAYNRVYFTRAYTRVRYVYIYSRFSRTQNYVRSATRPRESAYLYVYGCCRVLRRLVRWTNIRCRDNNRVKISGGYTISVNVKYVLPCSNTYTEMSRPINDPTIRVS